MASKEHRVIKRFQSNCLTAPHVKSIQYAQNDLYVVRFSNGVMLQAYESDFENSFNMKYFLNRCRNAPRIRFPICVQNMWQSRSLEPQKQRFWALEALLQIVSMEELGGDIVLHHAKKLGGYVGLPTLQDFIQKQPECKIQFSRWPDVGVIANIMDPNTRFILCSRSHCFVVVNGIVYDVDEHFSSQPRYWQDRHSLGVTNIDCIYQIVPKGQFHGYKRKL